jgi:predicted dehydrogenase
MGRVHLAALKASDQISLAGIVEPVERVRAALSGEHVPLFASPQELITAGTAEGVLIAAPSNVHATLVSEFAAASMPVLCEKPVGVSPSEAASARDAALQADVVLQVGYWRRFVPRLRELRARIESGELGEIYQLSCMQWDHEPPSASFRADCGGIAIDMGVHEIDQIRWLPPPRAGSHPRRHRRPIRMRQSCLRRSPAARRQRSRSVAASPTQIRAGSSSGPREAMSACRSCGMPTFGAPAAMRCS